MGISRGFRRLSLVVAVLGAATIAFIWLGNDAHPTTEQVLYGLSLFVIGPPIFILLLGWVAAGFQNSN
jgi:apolipoprotein N-acyltransferase